MRALRIDFVPSSPARAWHLAGPTVRLALLAGVLLCAGAAAAVGLILDALSTTIQARGRADDAAGAHSVPAVGPGVAADEVAAVNGAVERLNLPWRDVFDAVEQATPDSVALLALEPDAKHDVIRIVAEAGSTDDMLRYVERLKQQRFLSTVFLTKHEIDENDTNSPLRFQVEAHWRPES